MNADNDIVDPSSPSTSFVAAGLRSAFVIAYNATSGRPFWGKQFGKSGFTKATAIAVHGDHVYVTGVHTSGYDTPHTSNSSLGAVWDNQGGDNVHNEVWVACLHAGE